MDMPMTEPPITGVTMECIEHAAKTSGVSLLVLKGILQAEGGTPGRASLNRNGTKDVGPMQINTIWTKTFANMGVPMIALKNNGCANILAGTWILKTHLNDMAGDQWKAVARYHSKTRKYQYRYLRSVFKKLQQGDSLEKVVYQINTRMNRGGKRHNRKTNNRVNAHEQRRNHKQIIHADPKGRPLIAASAVPLGGRASTVK